MDYKEELRKAYDRYADTFEEKFQKRFDDFIRPELDNFMALLNGKKILDIGSGSGNHARYLHNKGYDVLCVDLSEEMVRRARDKGLRAEVMDMEHLTVPEKSFDGVWAYTSLLHIKKVDVPGVVEEIYKVIKPGGILGLSVKEGVGEGPESDVRHPDTQRWFAYFAAEEIKDFFKNHFESIAASKTNEGYGHEFISFLLRARQ